MQKYVYTCTYTYVCICNSQIPIVVSYKIRVVVNNTGFIYLSERKNDKYTNTHTFVCMCIYTNVNKFLCPNKFKDIFSCIC